MNSTYTVYLQSLTTRPFLREIMCLNASHANATMDALAPAMRPGEVMYLVERKDGYRGDIQRIVLASRGGLIDFDPANGVPPGLIDAAQ